MIAPAPPSDKDSGAALVTVLIMLVVMAALAAAVLEAARFSVARLENQTQMDQARWYLIGAERIAADRASLAAQAPGADAAAWQGQTLTYPIDGGAISIALHDGSNCFNLNSVVAGSEDQGLGGYPPAQMEFARLIEATGVSAFSPQGLAAALTDYLDTDAIPMPGGAEDQAYGGAGGQAYRPANTLMGDVSELMRVRGFSPELIAALAPLVCVRDTTAPSVLNVNTLRREEAATLSAIFGDSVPLSTAQSILASRPAAGWADVDAFFADPRIAALELSDEVRGRFAVRPRFLVLTARVRWQGLEEGSAALIEIGPPSRVVRRVFGAQASERSV